MSRPTGLYGDWNLSYLDAGNEIGTMKGVGRVVVGDDDDSNIEAQDTLWDAFVTATQALVLGARVTARYVNTHQNVPSVPTNGATRELKLLAMYRCTLTGKRYTLTVPTLSPTIPLYVQNVSVKDAVRVDAPSQITAWITAFNAFVIAPDIPYNLGAYATDPACTIIGLRVVGRNN